MEMDAHTTQALALSLLLSTVPLLPPGWQIARDPASGKFYFYNTSTGAVQWEPPSLGTTSAGAQALAAAASAAGEGGDAAAAAAAVSAAGALMQATGKRAADGTQALSAAGVLLAGAGGVAANHHPEKRARPGEGRQSDFESDVVSKLTAWCGEPTTWNTKKKVIDAFKTSPMWPCWVKAGHNEQKLVNFVNRLKIKHLEDGHTKDTGVGVAEFEAEVVEKLNSVCGETANWSTKKKVVDSFKDNPAFWTKWTAAGHSEQKLVNLINRLKIRHTEEAAKGTAAAAAALAAANGTAPPSGIIMPQGAVGGVSAFESEVVGQLQSLCGEASTWNTKKKVWTLSRVVHRHAGAGVFGVCIYVCVCVRSSRCVASASALCPTPRPFIHTINLKPHRRLSTRSKPLSCGAVGSRPDTTSRSLSTLSTASRSNTSRRAVAPGPPAVA